jgi:chromosome segregation ATPase
MSGISLTPKEPAVADRLIVCDNELTVYHGQPTQLSRFVRVIIGGVIGRLYFEELTPAEDQAYMVRHYDFVAQKQAADAAMAKADEAKRKAKDAAAVAQQMTQHNMQILAQLSQESDRRAALLKEKADLQEKHNATVADHADTVAKMHGAKQAAMEAAQAQIDALQRANDSLQDTILQQHTALGTMYDKLAQLDAAVTSLQATSTQAAVDNQALQAQLAAANAVKQADDGKIATLTAQLAASQANSVAQ